MATLASRHRSINQWQPKPEDQARSIEIGELAAQIRESGTATENMLLDEIEYLRTRCETRRKEAQRARRAARDAEKALRDASIRTGYTGRQLM